VNVLRLQDIFPIGTPDSEWLPEVGRQRWLLVSKDDRIRRREIERRALIVAGVRAIFYEEATLTAAQMVEAFRLGLPRISRLISKLEPPFVLRLGKTGRVKRLL